MSRALRIPAISLEPRAPLCATRGRGVAPTEAGTYDLAALAQRGARELLRRLVCGEEALDPDLLHGYVVRGPGTAMFLDAWAGSALFRGVVHPLFHNQIVAPTFHKTPGDAAAITRALEEAAPAAFAYLEGRRPGRFLVGGALSMADLAVASNLVMFRYLGHRIDERRYPRLHAWFEALRSSGPLAAALAAERAAVGTVAGLDPAI
jgi:hypothetical protein